MERTDRQIAFSKAVGANIRLACKRCGMTQADLASAAGVDRSYLIGIERGSRNFSVDALDRIAQTLNVPMWLILMPCRHLTG